MSRTHRRTTDERFFAASAEPIGADAWLMARWAISFAAGSYHVGGHRFERLRDAAEHASLVEIGRQDVTG